MDRRWPAESQFIKPRAQPRTRAETHCNADPRSVTSREGLCYAGRRGRGGRLFHLARSKDTALTVLIRQRFLSSAFHLICRMWLRKLSGMQWHSFGLIAKNIFSQLLFLLIDFIRDAVLALHCVLNNFWWLTSYLCHSNWIGDLGCHYVYSLMDLEQSYLLSCAGTMPKALTVSTALR